MPLAHHFDLTDQANDLITVVQQERIVGLQEAMNVSGDSFADYAKEFNVRTEQLPSWGPEVGASVSEHVRGMEACASREASVVVGTLEIRSRK